jgi:hypothetical protein
MFLYPSLVGVAGALTLAAGSPALATVPPVSVVSCNYNVLPAVSESLTPGTTAIDVSNLQITFVNQAPVAATDVKFAVQYAHHSQVVDASGTFSNGTPIIKDFSPSTNPGYNGSAVCSVQSVTFSDGSWWVAF